MTQSGKPTMAQMARELELTQATISLALRNHPRISTATRERVKAYAEKIGYKPDPLVSALMAQRRSKSGKGLGGTLGVISFWPATMVHRSFLQNSYFSSYREGIQQRAADLGYSVDWFDCDGTQEQTLKLLKTLRNRGIQGLIFGQSHISITEIPIDLQGFSAACIGKTLRDPVLSQVEPNHFAETSLACQKLLEDGVRRIGYFYYQINFQASDGRRLGAYTISTKDAPAACHIPPLCVDDVENFKPVEAWIRKHKPEALISERGDMLLALRERHPDIRLVNLTLQNNVSIEGIWPARREIGAAVVDMLVAQLHRGERGPPAIPKAVQIMGRWVGREEVSPPPPPC